MCTYHVRLQCVLPVLITRCVTFARTVLLMVKQSKNVGLDTGFLARGKNSNCIPFGVDKHEIPHLYVLCHPCQLPGQIKLNHYCKNLKACLFWKVYFSITHMFSLIFYNGLFVNHKNYGGTYFRIFAQCACLVDNTRTMWQIYQMRHRAFSYNLSNISRNYHYNMYSTSIYFQNQVLCATTKNCFCTSNWVM